MAVSSDVSTDVAAEVGVVRREASVVDSPRHEFMFVCELSVGEGGVFCVEREIHPV
jgi:hypothetical protein